MLQTPNWGVVYYSNRWVVLQKSKEENPVPGQQAPDALKQETEEIDNVYAGTRH